MVVDIHPRVFSLLLNELVLLCQTLLLLLTNLLLTILCLVEVFLAHSVQTVLHRVFLPANLLHNGHLLFAKVSVAEQKLLLLFLASSALYFLISLLLLLPLLLLTSLFKNFIVVFLLQVLELFCLLSGFLYLLDRPHLFVLEHSDSVPQLLDISLELQTNRASLVVRKVLALNIDHDVGSAGLPCRVCTLRGARHVSTTSVYALSEGSTITRASFAN